MSGNTKDKIAVRNNAGKTTPANTAHMANAYTKATILEKIQNLVAIFRHEKSTKTRLIQGEIQVLTCAYNSKVKVPMGKESEEEAELVRKNQILREQMTEQLNQNMVTTMADLLKASMKEFREEMRQEMRQAIG
ncbi:hypothetical protein F2Q68_00039296 [Brassica cretica]|uniref:Uncharacterized protein n=1 Tax=Brassica cretica TaxID=69181 RepID=A0A8S9MBK1_BRACR|nr:hypothetical protein F2Q68_00039296 [Brassica cretica]